MPVTFSFKADTGSNEPGLYSLKSISDQSYFYKRSSGHKVTVSIPIIDRLSLTIDVPSVTGQKKVRQALNKPGNNVSKTTVKKMNGYGAPMYSSNYRLNLGGSCNVFIQHTKGDADISFLRFDMNPSKLGKSKVQEFRNSLLAITGGVISDSNLMEAAKITRIDVAIDLINIDLEDLLVSTQLSGKSMAFFGTGGKAETHYLNKTKSGAKLIVYDKKQEQLDSGQDPVHGNTKYTRIERQLETKKNLKNLGELKNPFEGKVDLFDIEAPVPPEAVYHWKLFQDSCRYRGLAGALKQLPDGTRILYKNAIEAKQSEIWKPDKIWSYWPMSIEKSGWAV